MLTTFVVMALLADFQETPDSASSWIMEHRNSYTKALSLANEYIKHGKTRGGYVDIRIVGTDHNLETGAITSIEMFKEVIQQKKVMEYNKQVAKPRTAVQDPNAPVETGFWSHVNTSQFMEQEAPQ